jgi:hypothetical protein
MNKQSPNRLDLDYAITRRKFIGATALSSAALLTGGVASLLRPPLLQWQTRRPSLITFWPVCKQTVEDGLGLRPMARHNI